MSNSTNAPTGRYFEWLQASAKEAQRQKELPAKILAACQRKGGRILGGCPSDGRRNTHPHTELYEDIIQRVEENARGRGISIELLNQARKDVDRLSISEMLSLANNPLFEQLMPPMVLVMDVHSR